MLGREQTSAQKNSLSVKTSTIHTHPPGSASKSEARHLLEQAISKVTEVLWGNREVVELLMAAIVARGHVLLEDVPGVGKTTLAQAMARVLGCLFSRIQFTADMLPSDVLGVHVLGKDHTDLQFKKGPIFSDMVLADEINRASPKTQSAMLEAMSEGQVTVDDASFALPAIFSVIATQNPVEHYGAYPLPESQLDRFMIRLSIGYPPEENEQNLIACPEDPKRHLDALTPVLNPTTIENIQTLVSEVHMEESVAKYVLLLVQATRKHAEILLGCSPRGAALFSSMARAKAFLCGRDYVIPDDVKSLAVPVFLHRLVTGSGAIQEGSRTQARLVVEDILGKVPVPR